MKKAVFFALAVPALILAGTVLAWSQRAYEWMPGIGASPQEGLRNARARLTPELEKLESHLGAPVFIRIFKESRELEVWLQRDKDQAWSKYKTFEICTYSGDLGPKLREGDQQSPEGIYAVSAKQLNPNSSYHLSFNLGYPNAYDRANGRTGSYLMVHGECVSIGCYAMTNRGIEDIYALAEAALKNGQDKFQVQSFPARLEDDWLARHADSKWADFWTQLKPCYDKFEKDGVVPAYKVVDKKYVCS